MVNFEENCHFSRFQRGPTFSRGGGGSNFSFPIETHITCDFRGVVWTPCPPPPPSGSAFAENVNTIFSVVLMILGVINPPKYEGFMNRELLSG